MKVGDIFKSKRNILIIVGIVVIIIALGVFFFLSEEEPPAPNVPPRPRPAAGGAPQTAAKAPGAPEAGAQGTVEATAKAPAPPTSGDKNAPATATAKAPAPPSAGVKSAPATATAKAPAPPSAGVKSAPATATAKAPAPPSATATKAVTAQKAPQAPKKETVTSKKTKKHFARLSGKWAINTASFINKDEARKFTATLKKAGYNAYMTTFFKDGENWNRVRVGFYKSKEEADRVADKISSKYDVSSPWVVMPSSGEVSKNSR